MFRVGRSDVDVHTYKRIYSPIHADFVEGIFLVIPIEILHSKVSLVLFNLIINQENTNKIRKIYV